MQPFRPSDMMPLQKLSPPPRRPASFTCRQEPAGGDGQPGEAAVVQCRRAGPRTGLPLCCHAML